MIRRYDLLTVFISQANTDNPLDAPVLISHATGIRETDQKRSTTIQVTTIIRTYNYSARDRASNLSIREHEIVTTFGTTKVLVHGVGQLYPLNVLDPEIDVGELGPTVLLIPGFVWDLWDSSEIRAPG